MGSGLLSRYGIFHAQVFLNIPVETMPPPTPLMYAYGQWGLRWPTR